MKFLTRRPRTIRLLPDGSLACQHHDTFCCATCAELGNIVEVLGQFYWVADQDERDALLASIAEVEAEMLA